MSFTNTLATLLAVTSLISCLQTVQAQQDENKDSGFVSLFNGTDLTGWDGDPRLWSVKDGVIHGETTKEKKAKRNTFLIWQGGDVADFELKLTFRCNSTNNSGVQYRSRHITDPSAPNKWVVRGYQHEIRNENTAPNVPGFIYDEGGKRKRICLAGEKARWDKDGKTLIKKILTDEEIKALVKLDDWNEVRIVAKGQRLKHFLNGKKILDCTDAHPDLALPSGVIALQLHGGKPMWAEFKDISLKKLDAEPNAK